MKKILVLMLALVMALSVCAFAACGATTYAGEYKYANPWDATKFYGVKVDVSVKKDVIKSVTVTSTDTEEYTNLSAGWANKQTWLDGQAAFLNSFVDMPVADVFKVNVACDAKGQPAMVTGMDYVAGATQSSGRVILAVQDALKEFAPADFAPTVAYAGEYKYENAWTAGQYYRAKVTVAVKSNTVIGVTVAADTETEYNLSAGWASKQTWLDGQAAFLNSFVGMPVADVFNVVVACEANGQPTTVTGMEYVAGATQSSGRVILAVQNALASFAPADYGVALAGEYKYANPWDATKFYGVKVAVVVKEGVIKSVAVASANTEEYTNLSSSWTDKSVWENGEAAFLASFVGKTVAEVNAVVVECAESGQPNTVTGMEYVTGATQSSGRVILAIQNALTKLPQ